jgi:hypothetical protein
MDNNRKIRKTSIDLYPNYKKNESSTLKKISEAKNSKNDVEKIKKNLILDFIDFPDSNNEEEKKENNLDLDEYLSLNAKPLNCIYKPDVDNLNQCNDDKSKNYKFNENNKQLSKLSINPEKEISDYNIDEKIKRKKKSLLRRTTSAPKLVGCSDENEKDDTLEGDCNKVINLEVNKNRSSLKFERQSKQIEKQNCNEGNNDKSNHIHVAHSEGENKEKNKKEIEVDYEDENEILSELSSPYNELFFYLFENLLEEYMKTRYKQI